MAEKITDLRVAQGMDDQTYADALAHWWKTTTAEDGSRLTWDPVAGVWRNDVDLVRNARARNKVRNMLGSTKETYGQNKWEQTNGLQ